MKHLILLKIHNMMDNKQVLRLWFINFVKSQGDGINNKIKQNEQLAEELHKPIIKIFKKEESILHLKTIFGVLI